MRKLIASLVAAGLITGLVGAASAAPKQVMTDTAGDAGNQDSGIPGADQAGFDLVAASIDKVKTNLEFTVEHAAMPPNGALPEGFRFLWHIMVNAKDEFRFTVKSADIGKPDVIAQNGQDRVGQVWLNGVFRLETCAEEPLPAVLTLVNCKTVEYLDGKFDPAAKTFTIIVPLKLIKAKTGSTIAGGTFGSASSGCQICWIPHYAERSLTPATIIDSATQSVTYKVPR